MKRSALFAAVALLALAACASDKSNDSGSKSTTSTKGKGTTSTLSPAQKKNSAKAFALARRVGCTAPKLNKNSGGGLLGLPKPIASVSCTASNIRYRVDVYANHAARVALLAAPATKIRCALLKALGSKGPIYTVDGDDFSATASGPPGTKDSLALAKALGVKLDLPVTTTKCPA
jgi:ABC-type Fe3+-hydroxamate transport system substrate-binding protein